MSVDVSGRRSYLPGTWFGIFGENAAVLLPPTEKRRVAALWELLDDGADFDEVLDALITTGLRDLPGFVLVSDSVGDDQTTTRVVVRGTATATFETDEGPVVVEATGAGTWVERTITRVTGTVLDVSQPEDQHDDIPPREPMTLVGGLVRVSRVQSPAVPATAPATAPGAEPEDAHDHSGGGPAVAAVTPAVAAVPTAGADGPGDHEAEAAPVAPTDDGGWTPPGHDVDTEPGVELEEPVAGEEPVGEPTEMMSLEDLTAASEDAPDPAYDSGYTPGETLEETPEDTPEPEDRVGPPPAPDFGVGAMASGPQWSPAPAPSNPFGPRPDAPGPQGSPVAEPSGDAPAPAPVFGEPDHGSDHGSDHDGDTRAGDYDADVYARSQPGIPGQPPAPSGPARPVARLLVSQGESIDVDRVILVGRAPEARRFTATDQPRLVTVPSPNQEISSTHLEVRPGSGADHGSAVVTDLGSTNGTVLVQPGLPPEDLQPGVAVQLIPGAVIDLGDGLTIQVANP